MTEQGLINSKSYMTCISVPDRTDKDWLFWAGPVDAMASAVRPAASGV